MTVRQYSDKKRDGFPEVSLKDFPVEDAKEEGVTEVISPGGINCASEIYGKTLKDCSGVRIPVAVKKIRRLGARKGERLLSENIREFQALKNLGLPVVDFYPKLVSGELVMRDLLSNGVSRVDELKRMKSLTADERAKLLSDPNPMGEWGQALGRMHKNAHTSKHKLGERLWGNTRSLDPFFMVKEPGGYRLVVTDVDFVRRRRVRVLSTKMAELVPAVNLFGDHAGGSNTGLKAFLNGYFTEDPSPKRFDRLMRKTQNCCELLSESEKRELKQDLFSDKG